MHIKTDPDKGNLLIGYSEFRIYIGLDPIQLGEGEKKDKYSYRIKNSLKIIKSLRKKFACVCVCVY